MAQLSKRLRVAKQSPTLTHHNVSRRAFTHLRQFRREVDEALPGLVTKVMLFGSRARGDDHKDSDYDVAVFIRDLDPDDYTLRHAVIAAAYPHFMAGVYISPRVVPADYLEGSHPLATNISRDGITIR